MYFYWTNTKYFNEKSKKQSLNLLPNKVIIPFRHWYFWPDYYDVSLHCQFLTLFVICHNLKARDVANLSSFNQCAGEVFIHFFLYLNIIISLILFLQNIREMIKRMIPLLQLTSSIITSWFSKHKFRTVRPISLQLLLTLLKY